MTRLADHPVDPVVVEGTPSPALLSPAPTIVTLLWALRRRWVLAASLGALSAASAFAVGWFATPTRYTAKALLDVAANPPKVIFNTNENRIDPFHTFQKKQLALVRSRPVVAAALRQPKVAELSAVREQLDPVEWLEQRVQGDYSVAPEILRISMTGDRPQELVVLVDAVTEAYLQEIVNKEHKRRLERLDQLKELYNTHEDTLRRKRQALRDLAASAGSGDAKTLALKHRFAIEQLALAEKELMDVQSHLRKVRVEVADLLAKRNGPDDLSVPESAVEEQVKRDPLVQQYVKQAADLEEFVDGLKRVTARGDGEPALRKAHKDLEAARAALTARRAEARPQVVAELRQRARDDAGAMLIQLQGRTTLLVEHEKVLGEVVDRLRKETQSMNQSGLSLGSLQDDIPRAENLVKTVAAELDALNVELQAPPRITLLETAALSPMEARKRRLMVSGGAALAALALVLGGISWWEFRSRRVNTVDEVVHGLGVNLIGAVPCVPDRAQHSLVRLSAPRDGYWRNVLTESVNAIRTMLLHAAGTGALRVVMVTSATGGEGKTSLSSHLAISLARAGRRTLLVDTDLRRPAVHRVFDLAVSPGLSELLCDQADSVEAIQPGPVGGLWVLPAGRATGPAIQALAQGRIPAVFDRLREQFDIIVVDSCPVLPVADALQVAQHVDGVIFTLLREVSRLPQVYAGYQRLSSLGVRMLGIVVNGAGGEAYGSSYSDYYYVEPAAAE
jgi:capsular exopolysaccharide synthesis family protein